MSAPAGTAAPRGNISGYNVKNLPQFTSGQMKLFQQLLGGLTGGGGLQGGVDFLSGLAGGDEEMFGEAEAPAYSAFQKTLGDLGTRFSGYGGGALDSSGFQQATSGAARDLAENLQSKRLGLRQGAIDQLLGLSDRTLQQRPYDTFAEKKRSGFDTAADVVGLLVKILPLFL